MPKLQKLLQVPVNDARTTVEQFLCNPIAGLDSSQVSSEQALIETLNSLQTHVAPCVWNGKELLSHLQNHARLLPTGCVRVDELLCGGLREGHLTELFGESASGKTQLCMMAAVAAAMRGEQVTYIDTTGSFSGRRAASIFNTLQSRVQGGKPCRLLQILQSIKALVTSSNACQPNLVILDSVSALITPILGAGGPQQSQAHALMSALGRMLKYVAAQYTAAVLCTNHMVGSGSNPRPALGESWKVQPHTRLQLLRPDVGDERFAVISASATSVCGQQVTFQLS
ncbi:hypothetical protein WJX79_010245 [Trebouxia sp. C0005]